MQVALGTEDVEAIAVRVAALIVERLPAPAASHRWLTSREAADYVRISLDGLHRLSGSGAIPHAKQGGRLLFDRIELDEWVRGYSVTGYGISAVSGASAVSTPFPPPRKAA